MTDSSRASSNRATLLPETEADQWAQELSTWAASKNEPEAGDARLLVEQIGGIARDIRATRSAEDQSGMSSLMERLGSLRQRALAMLATR